MQNYFDNEATSSVHATMKPARGGKCLVTFSTYEDRQEALMRTTIMDDPTTYRAKGCKQNKFDVTDNSKDPGRQEDTSGVTHIPKPPPMQLTSNNLKSKSPSAPKSLYENHVQSRTSNGFTNGSDGNDPTILRNLNRNSTANVSPSSCNRQTLRLGTVSIGEYRNNNTRKEPEKFDFITSAAKRNDSGDITPTNESLHSELHSTLSRSKLKKTNSSNLEHQRNCPLNQQQQHTSNHHHHHHHHQQQQQQQQTQHHRPQHQHNHSPPHQSSSAYEYQNVNINQPTYSVSEMSRKLQKTSLNGGSASTSSHTTTSGGSSTFHGSAGVGILKNGNRNSSNNNNNSNKSTEKSIKFG